ncbi:MAG: kelch repeat-containing protein, partial [Rhodoferax sp.]
TASLLGTGSVLLVGGTGGVTLASAELYDPAANTWSTAGNLAVARSAHTATVLTSGKVLAVGGSGVATLNSAELSWRW